VLTLLITLGLGTWESISKLAWNFKSSESKAWSEYANLVFIRNRIAWARVIARPRFWFIFGLFLQRFLQSSIFRNLLNPILRAFFLESPGTKVLTEHVSCETNTFYWVFSLGISVYRGPIFRTLLNPILWAFSLEIPVYRVPYSGLYCTQCGICRSASFGICRW
jgi:hypothetical protein